VLRKIWQTWSNVRRIFKFLQLWEPSGKNLVLVIESIFLLSGILVSEPFLEILFDFFCFWQPILGDSLVRAGSSVRYWVKCRGAHQGCQMVHIFSNQNPNLGKFWRVLRRKMLVYYVAIWNICGRLVNFSRFWYVVQEKSGNPGAHLHQDWKKNGSCKTGPT
jgi:hypothetical protein